MQAARGSSDGDEADEEMADVEVQPLGTVSFRNKSYYCEVEKVRVKVVEKDSTEAKVQIFINSRCDLSEGALDNPNNVQLLLGEDDSQVAATFESFLTYAQDDFQVTGVATFSVSEENMESLLSEKVSFRYSEEGYEPVVIFLPGSSYRFDNSPKCTNCDEVMVITAETDNGLIWCKFCDESSNGEYWWCSHCAATDFDVCYCFKCKQSLCLHPVCASDHPMKRLNGAPKCYMSDASCDKCNKNSLSQEYRQFYHCEDCKFDLCITCAYEEEKGATED